MKKSNLCFVRILCLSLLSAFAFSSAYAATELARVNNKVITLEDFNKKYQEILSLYPTQPPTKQSFLNDMIKRELGAQEARRLKIDQDPSVQEEINAVLYQIQITDTDARAAYTRAPDVRTSHIFISVAPGASKQDEATALATIRNIQKNQLGAGKSFAEVAQKFSEGVAAPMGGDIDYQAKTQLDPAYYAAALRLKTPGRVSDVVRSQFGFHIIKLTAIRPWSEVDPAIVKQNIFNERKSALEDRLLSSVRGRAKIQTKAELLR
jgi:parvulin-like peptidyl-prolyl isomerase